MGYLSSIDPKHSVLFFFFIATSFTLPFPPPPLLTTSAMNMDRFEKGPREILNPEIQKVRLMPEHWPALKEMLHRSISCQAWSAAPKLYNIFRLCHLYLENWSVWSIIFVSFFLRICWCWRNRRYGMTLLSQYSLAYSLIVFCRVLAFVKKLLILCPFAWFSFF